MIILTTFKTAVNTDNYDYVIELVQGATKKLQIVRQDNGGDLIQDLTDYLDADTFNFYANSYFQAVQAGLSLLNFNV